MITTSDQELVKRLNQGEEAALEQLYHRYVARIRGFLAALRLSRHAEDVIQDTFLTLWNKRKHIDAGLSFESYIFTIAKNHALKALKKQLHTELDAVALNVAETGPAADDLLFYRDLKESISSALEELPDRPRQVFKLRREDGLTTKEIADRLGISASTVENHLNRALHHIRDNLPAKCLLLFLYCHF